MGRKGLGNLYQRASGLWVFTIIRDRRKTTCSNYDRDKVIAESKKIIADPNYKPEKMGRVSRASKGSIFVKDLRWVFRLNGKSYSFLTEERCRAEAEKKRNNPDYPIKSDPKRPTTPWCERRNKPKPKAKAKPKAEPAQYIPPFPPQIDYFSRLYFRPVSTQESGNLDNMAYYDYQGEDITNG